MSNEQHLQEQVLPNVEHPGELVNRNGALKQKAMFTGSPKFLLSYSLWSLIQYQCFIPLQTSFPSILSTSVLKELGFTRKYFLVVESLGSGPLPLTFGPWAGYFVSVYIIVLNYKSGNSFHCTELLRMLNEIVHGKCLAQWLQDGYITQQLLTYHLFLWG